MLVMGWISTSPATIVRKGLRAPCNRGWLCEKGEIVNQEFKARWLAALRSGEYRQGTGLLRTGDDRFCCLGVACDLLVKQGVLPDWRWEVDDNGNGGSWTVQRAAESLPHQAMQVMGMKTAFGLLPGREIDDSNDYALSVLNDYGATFEQIADIIEREI